MQGNGQQKFVPSEQQRRAIEHVDGPMLVVAGAGTGKTSVLSHRIAHLINREIAKPNEILAVTYTRNAAAELIERVAKLLYPKVAPQQAARKLMASGLEANTFHAYCFELLGRAGVKFDLIDEKDLYVYLRRRVAELKLEYFIESANLGKFLRDLLDFFDRCQDELRTPDHYDGYVARVARGEIPLPRVVKSKKAEAMPADEVLGRCREIARIYRQLEEMLAKDGLGTFGHIITRAVDLLSRRDSVLQGARNRARFILIDEFQDSNVAQIRLANLLGGEQANVFAVGDPDQGIYRFRGASSEAFDQFLNIFGVERVQRVTMSANRRSTPPILSCAYQAIRCNPEVGSAEIAGGGWPREPLTCARLHAEPRLARAPAVEAIVHTGNEHEAWLIGETIDAMRQQQPGRNLSEIAVLYAQHNHRDALLAELRRRDIPAEVKGVNLFDAPEVRDALAVLRVLDSTDAVAVVRVAALDCFSVDPARFRAEMALAGRDPSPEAVLEKVTGGAEVLNAIRVARHEVAATNSTLAAAFDIGQRVFHLADSMPLQCLRQFTEIWAGKPKPICGSGTLREFLEYLKLFREVDGLLAENNEDADPREALAPRDLGVEPQNAVQLMTIHSAKGLEFPCVFVVRVVSGSLPTHEREPLVEFPRELRNLTSDSEDDSKKLHAEEQRRLFYVAITRARDALYLCGKVGSEKKQPAPPSRYLRELVNCAALRGALEYRLLPEPAVEVIQAAAEGLPAISQWMLLPPRDDARFNELSASAIDHYERCPLAFKLGRDWRIPEEPGAALEFGGAMHLALKAYFDGVRAGRPLAEEDVIACFLAEFAKAKIPEEEQRRRCQQDGREQLARLLRSTQATPEGEILENERRFSVSIAGTTVKGRMDRLERLDHNQVRIIDYKTGAARLQEDADKSLQLSVYALAAQQEDLNPVSLVFINTRDGTVVETARTPAQLLNAATKVSEVAAKIAAGEFAPRPGQQCRTCSYYGICPDKELIIPASPAAHEVAGDQTLLPFPN